MSLLSDDISSWSSIKYIYIKIDVEKSEDTNDITRNRKSKKDKQQNGHKGQKENAMGIRKGHNWKQ